MNEKVSLEKTFKEHGHWESVKAVSDRLVGQGYQALLAGGCVRDALMGRVPNDFDVATSATPEQVEALFEKSVNVGKVFGVIVLPFDGFSIEVATFRKDGLYVDGRRPTEVIYSSPKEDAERRDFTINALFYDLKSQKVIDHVGGLADLASGRIRTVGEARLRFEEDQLRLMRAVRFAAQLDFEIESKTFDAIKALSPKIPNVSVERIHDELMKLLSSRSPNKGLFLLEVSGLMEQVLPELYQVALNEPLLWNRSKALMALTTKPDTVVRLSLLLQAVPLQASKILERLKFSRNEIKEQLTLLENLKELSNAGIAARRKMLAQPCGEKLLGILDLHAQMELDQGLAAEMHQLTPAEAAWVTGQDALSLGIEAGPQMGRLLQEIYDEQLSGLLKSKSDALGLLKSKSSKK